jgi:Na+/H+ antiporter NhaC
MRTSETGETSTTERPNFFSVFRFCFFSSSSSFFSFFYVFSLFFFRRMEQEHKQVSAQRDLFVQNEEHALRTRANFLDYDLSGLWIFFVWCSVMVLVYCTKK